VQVGAGFFTYTRSECEECEEKPGKCIASRSPFHGVSCLAGIQKPDWMRDQVRHDVQYPAACDGVVYCGFRLLGDQHRALRLFYNVLRDAADKKSGYACPSEGSYHNQVNLFFLLLLQYLI
jgi:hypothetical protein